MSINFVTAAATLATLLPNIAHLFQKTESHPDITQRLLDIAKKMTGSQDDLDAMTALKKSPPLLIEFQRTVAHLQHDLERSYLDDKRDSRARDMAIITAGRSNKRADIMAMAAALGLVGCMICLVMLQGKLPGEAIGIISTIAGIFGACLKDAYGFEFGSSRGSYMKDMAAMRRL